MDQYKIPQNIGIEDKIVGPLTLRQLIIVASGFGISYVLFAIISRLYEINILEYIIIAIPLLFAVAIAMIKIRDKSLLQFILLFLEFSIKPKKRVWDHRGISAIVMPDLGGKVDLKALEPKVDEIAQKATKAKNLNELSKVLDSGSFAHVDDIEHEDLDESEDEDLVTQAYFGHTENTTENMYWRTKESHKKRLDLFAKLPVTNLKKGSKEAKVMEKEIMSAKQEVKEMQREVQAKKEAPKRLTPTALKQPAAQNTKKQPAKLEQVTKPKEAVKQQKPIAEAKPEVAPVTQSSERPRRFANLRG